MTYSMFFAGSVLDLHVSMTHQASYVVSQTSYFGSSWGLQESMVL